MSDIEMDARILGWCIMMAVGTIVVIGLTKWAWAYIDDFYDEVENEEDE